MSFRFTYTKRFEKHYLSLHNSERKQVKKKLALLSENPMHPSLRSKRIQGTDGYMEASVNMDIRIIWFYEGNDLIILLDVGHHDILKQY